MESLSLKRHKSFQNRIEKPHSFAPRPPRPDLIFKLQQEILKFNDVFVNWSSQKLT